MAWDASQWRGQDWNDSMHENTGENAGTWGESWGAGGASKRDEGGGRRTWEPLAASPQQFFRSSSAGATRRGKRKTRRGHQPKRDGGRFVCVFLIGIEAEADFCLVKRIIGKAGNNTRKIAEECNVKVRLRGIGSGYLEGKDGVEADVPLQLTVTSTEYDSFTVAINQAAQLLEDIYEHYRRYIRSKGKEPPELKLHYHEGGHRRWLGEDHRLPEPRLPSMPQEDQVHPVPDDLLPAEEFSDADEELGAIDSLKQLDALLQQEELQLEAATAGSGPRSYTP